MKNIIKALKKRTKRIKIKREEKKETVAITYLDKFIPLLSTKVLPFKD